MAISTRPDSADAFCAAGEQLLKDGAALVAYDTLAEGLKSFPSHVRLRQLLALALARSGASRLANQILEELARAGHADEETLGLLARTHKDLWAGSSEPSERRRHLQLAFDHYRAAHAVSSGYWSGINAATMALLLGRRDDAAPLARGARARCLARRQDADRGELYWILATLGEAALLLGDGPEAEDWYSQAAALGRESLGNVVSTRRNARLILEHLNIDGSRIEACLRVPRVVVFVGHLIDRPGRPTPRFPPALEPAVRRAILDRLHRLDVGVGYASAGCGGDILFLESLGEIQAETRIVLPYNREQFLEDSVDLIPGADWPARYARALATAKDVTVASEQRMAGSGMSFEYGFRMLDGTAGLRADELDTDVVCLALWDGRPGDGIGGTASSVERWRKDGRRLEIIDLAELTSESSVTVRGPEQVQADESGGAPAKRRDSTPDRFKLEIVGLLFADVRGFTKLTEEEIPLFVEHFLGLVGGEIGHAAHPPILANTWGDGLYFVFRDVGQTGDFALRLCEAVRSTDWRAKGFREDIGLRIGLHAGPVYSCLDPVTGRPNYIGAHVSHAARIEPIAPPGEVYASGAFAALVCADRVQEFVCSYVGQTPLAKGYGTFPTYVVHRRHTGRETT